MSSPIIRQQWFADPSAVVSQFYDMAIGALARCIVLINRDQPNQEVLREIDGCIASQATILEETDTRSVMRDHVIASYPIQFGIQMTDCRHSLAIDLAAHFCERCRSGSFEDAVTDLQRFIYGGGQPPGPLAQVLHGVLLEVQAERKRALEITNRLLSQPAASSTREYAGQHPAELDQPRSEHPHMFARLPDGRYRVRFGEQEDTLRAYKGLDLIHHLLRHANQDIELLALNRDLYSAPAAPGEIEVSEDQEKGGLPHGYTLQECAREERLSPSHERRVTDEIERLTELAQVARANGDKEEARKWEQQIETARNYLREHGAKQSLSPEQDAIRKKLDGNVRTAYRCLEPALSQLLSHLKVRIKYGNGAYRYISDAAISWSFDPPR